MRAVICARYGPPEVLQLTRVAKPTPKDDEVLVRVHTATVMAGDCELRGLRVPFVWKLLLRLGFGFTAPRRKILGQELAGEVESVGTNVRLYKEGDQVFGNTGLRLGAYAEYACLHERGWLAAKPSNVSFEDAATFPSAGLYVLPLMRKGNIQTGQKVLIIGAGGTMGTLAVQLAKQAGAQVTAVDSTGKLEMLRSIGADRVIDYTRDDYTKSGGTYDVILDMIGKVSFSGCMGILREGGTFLLGNPGLAQLARKLLTRKGSKRVMTGRASYQVEDLTILRELVEAGKVRPVIDRRYPLEDVAEAHRYVETGQKLGNVVIVIGGA